MKDFEGFIKNYATRDFIYFFAEKSIEIYKNQVCLLYTSLRWQKSSERISAHKQWQDGNKRLVRANGTADLHLMDINLSLIHIYQNWFQKRSRSWQRPASFRFLPSFF